MIAESGARSPLRLPSLVALRERRYGGTEVDFFALPEEART